MSFKLKLQLLLFVSCRDAMTSTIITGQTAVLVYLMYKSDIWDAIVSNIKIM